MHAHYWYLQSAAAPFENKTIIRDESGRNDYMVRSYIHCTR